MKRLRYSAIAVLLSLLLVFSAGCTVDKTVTSSVDYSSTYSALESQKDNSLVTENNKSSANNNFSKTIENKTVGKGKATPVTQIGIPKFSGKPYVAISNNIPNFSSAELTVKGYEKYSPLDSLGRVGVALASLGKETMPKENEKRGSISNIKPTGWVQSQYDNISGKYLYNRCHLIGWQLSAENDNPKNLMTGTKYFNVSGMLPFENMVADYIKETGNHVAYRVTPIFEGKNLLASGVQLEAYSVEDSGKGVCFNVYCFNIQSKININYATGASSSAAENINSSVSSLASSAVQSTPSSPKVVVPTVPETNGELVWVPTNGGKKYHSRSNCSNMKDPIQVTKETAESNGFTPCAKCH